MLPVIIIMLIAQLKDHKKFLIILNVAVFNIIYGEPELIVGSSAVVI